MGGVANAAFEHFKTMSAEDFKLEIAKPAVKDPSTRGRKVTKTENIPSLPARMPSKKSVTKSDKP